MTLLSSGLDGSSNRAGFYLPRAEFSILA